MDYVLVLWDVDATLREEHDRHVEGLFERALWLRSIEAVGYRAEVVPFGHSDFMDPIDVFVGRRPR